MNTKNTNSNTYITWKQQNKYLINKKYKKPGLNYIY